VYSLRVDIKAENGIFKRRVVGEHKSYKYYKKELR